jgi:hypothetical protein
MLAEGLRHRAYQRAGVVEERGRWACLVDGSGSSASTVVYPPAFRARTVDLVDRVNGRDRALGWMIAPG